MTYKELQDLVLKKFSSSKRPEAKQWLNYRLQLLWSLEEWTFRTDDPTVTVTAGSKQVTGVPADLGEVLALLDEDGAPLRYREPAEFWRRHNDAAESSGEPEDYTVIGGELFVGPAPDTGSSAWRLVHERRLGKYVSTTLNGAVTLPTGTITVASTTGFPSSGRLWVAGQIVSYTGKTATTFTGCTGGEGSLPTLEVIRSMTPIAGLLVNDTDVPAIPDETHLVLVHGAQTEGQAIENDPGWRDSQDLYDVGIDGMRRAYLASARGFQQVPAYRPC